MRSHWPYLTLLATLMVACGPGTTPSAETRPDAGAGQAALPACEPSPQMAVEGRASPYDSTLVPLGDAQARVCYGRPSMNERVIFGQLVPFNRLWRTGANEPTILHLPVAARLGSLDVPAGSYSLYTIPGPQNWTVIVNRSTSQWGHESQYTEDVAAQELGRFQVPAEATGEEVEQFTIRAEPPEDANHLILEWERTRVRIPIQAR